MWPSPRPFTFGPLPTSKRKQKRKRKNGSAAASAHGPAQHAPLHPPHFQPMAHSALGFQSWPSVRIGRPSVVLARTKPSTDRPAETLISFSPHSHSSPCHGSARVSIPHAGRRRRPPRRAASSPPFSLSHDPHSASTVVAAPPAGPLADACVHPRVGAPPSSGSAGGARCRRRPVMEQSFAP